LQKSGCIDLVGVLVVVAGPDASISSAEFKASSEASDSAEEVDESDLIIICGTVFILCPRTVEESPFGSTIFPEWLTSPTIFRSFFFNFMSRPFCLLVTGP